MTELFFKGKEFVYNHHLAVPHRPLVADAARSVEAPDLSGNLIIQGDNLHALKSLLPHYAGRVDCIFIDPPYNTGNEGWRYNDKVNAPMIKAWLDENPVGVDDGLRHDKWCAMMWPRLKLLHELLAEDGVIFICIDDNEQHCLRHLMAEIFGNENLLAQFCWRRTDNQSNIGSVARVKDYIISFSKTKGMVEFNKITLSERAKKEYRYSDDIGKYRRTNLIDKTRGGHSYTCDFGLITIDSDHWTLEKDELLNLHKEDKIYWAGGDKKNSDKKTPYGKRYLSETEGQITSDWLDISHGTNQQGAKELDDIFDKRVFDYPKPQSLAKFFVQLATDKDALILDSFAGSGTTAHAVLKANAEDGGNRKFIMVEMEEDIADSVTSERIRRVINGYSHGDKTTDGLGGTFTFCTLGEAIDLNRILSGETLPEHKTLAPVLFHMATNETLDAVKTKSNKPYYVGETEHEVMWMIYEPDLDWLKSDAAALTLSKAKAIAATDPDKDHLVFAPARFVSQKVLKEENLKVKFVPFPDALYQIEREGE